MILVAPYSFNFSEHLGAWAPIKSSSAHKDLCHESSSVLQLSPRSSTDDFFSQKTCSHQQIISFKKGPNHLLGYPALFWPTLRFLKDRITTKYKQRHMTKTNPPFKRWWFDSVARRKKMIKIVIRLETIIFHCGLEFLQLILKSPVIVFSN